MRLQANRFLQLALGAFGLVIGSFVVRGFGQLVVSVETAQLLSTPLFLGGFGLAALAAVLSVLVKLGIVGLDVTSET
jgi:hypothetical protein